jgi:hypothetical protein
MFYFKHNNLLTEDKKGAFDIDPKTKNIVVAPMVGKNK